MNEVIRKDYRSKDNLKWLNDNYFIAIYNSNEYITSFENIDSVSQTFNIPIAKILKYIRYNISLKFNDMTLNMYLYKKEPINENYKRRR